MSPQKPKGENARGSVSRVLSTPDQNPGMGDHSSRTAIARRLQQPTRIARRKRPLNPKVRAIPIRFCSRWGLPCRPCYQGRGALLPHRFALTLAPETWLQGGLFCVALSLGSPPPGVTRHRTFRGARTFLAPACARPRPPDPLTRGALAEGARRGKPKREDAHPAPARNAAPLSPPVSSESRIARHWPSITASRLAGRKRRWKARTAASWSTMS